MDQRDQELLNKQMRWLIPPRNDAVIGYTILAAFFAGMMLGGVLFAYNVEPMRLTLNHDAAVPTAFLN
jgi:hypothetical protein